MHSGHDDGQQSIARALHRAIDYALSKNAVTYRPTSAADYHLSQINLSEMTPLELVSPEHADDHHGQQRRHAPVAVPGLLSHISSHVQQAASQSGRCR